MASESIAAADGGPTSPWQRVLASHWPFGLLFAGGVALRIVTSLAYLPALLYIDSLGYLNNVFDLRPSGARPIGYSVFLRPFVDIGDLRLIPLTHHVMGLAMAVGIYVVLQRAGVRRWLAALATAPVLLDAYQLQIEQNVLSETLFQTMVFVGLVVLVDGAGRQRSWPRRVATAAVAGGILGLAVPVRLIGQFLVVPAVLYLLVDRDRGWWQRVVAAATFVVVFAIPVFSYMAYFASWTGSWSLTAIGGRMLYGRTAVLVDCGRIDVPADMRDLCPDEPLDQRLKIDNYVWNIESPINRHTPPPGVSIDVALREFAGVVIRQQPIDVARAVLTDMGKAFWPTKAQFSNDVDVGRWHFKQVYPRYDNYLEWLAAFGSRPQVDIGLAGFLVRYQQSVGYTPGPVFAVAIVVGLAAGFGAGQARRSRLRPAILLWTVAGALVMLLPASYEFSWRYILPGLVTLPVAGALGFTALTGRKITMSATTERRAGPADGDAVDAAALARFSEEYDDPKLGPVAVVIAAYDEQDGLPGVLVGMPTTVEAEPVSVVVVDDGSTDATAAVARSHGAHVVEPGRNRGQGAALRLGYRVAREHGARWIATLDADGQYDPAELTRVLGPVLRDEADFVTGSRRLGAEQTTDAFRRLGVRFYARLVSALTRQRITDTSNGLRAMRADVTDTVALTQPQYQSSELLIGALAHGFRVLEVPTTMRERTAGQSKKGNNFLYGLRYGRVVIGSWLRERARHRAAAGRP